MGIKDGHNVRFQVVYQLICAMARISMTAM
jgi:hypothetical protein